MDGKEKPWGESAVAELANGSVVLTSRLSQPLTTASRWRAFAISHTGGESWDKAWTFPADQVRLEALVYTKHTHIRARFVAQCSLLP